MEVIPAIIPKNYEDLCAHLGVVRGVARTVQIDVTDGVFAGRPSWPFNDAARFESMVKQIEGLPLWEDFDFEVDLMVADPVREAERFIDAGAFRVIIHLASVLKRGDTIIDDVKRMRERAEVVAAIGVEGDIKDIERVFGQVDGVQCMGIARIGFQGEAFDPRALAQVEAARALYPDLPIAVDGAVSEETIPDLTKAGATRFVAGSAIFGSGDAAADRYDALVELCQG